MLTININYEVLSDRLITIKLPEEVSPGRHDVVIMVDEKEPAREKIDSDAQKLMQFSGAVTAFREIDGVEYQ